MTDEYDHHSRLMAIRHRIKGNLGTLGGYAKEQIAEAIDLLDSAKHGSVDNQRRLKIHARDLIRNTANVLQKPGRKNDVQSTELNKVADNLEYEELELSDELGEDDLL